MKNRKPSRKISATDGLPPQSPPPISSIKPPKEPLPDIQTHGLSPQSPPPISSIKGTPKEIPKGTPKESPKESSKESSDK